jgi:cadmium resistance protein CadD (predicted permease)
VTLLVGVALVIGTTLDSVPLRVVGLLAVAPAALAVHAFRHRHEPAQALARGAFTTFVTTVGFGGDNLAVWTPLFRALSTSRTFLTVAIFAALDVGVIALARGVAGHPRVVRAATRTAPQLTPWLYLILTVVVIWECHLI